MLVGGDVGDRDIAIGRELEDAHDERVAGRRSFDQERADFSGPRPGDLGIGNSYRPGTTFPFRPSGQA